MKAFKYIFMAFGVIAAVAIALGAYWHIYTLGASALMVWTIKKDINQSKTNAK